MKFSVMLLTLPLVFFSQGNIYANNKVNTQMGGNHILIDNGSMANQKEAPFNAIVRVTMNTKDGFFSCTGTLLNYNTVLTAGHCAFDLYDGTRLSPSAFTVVRYPSPYESESYQVTNVVSNYNEQNMGADFSLLRIDNKDKNVPVAKLASSGMTRQTLLKTHPALLTAGYGIDRERGYLSPGFLQKGNVTPTQDNYANTTLKKAYSWLNRSINDPSEKVDIPYDPVNEFATCSNTPTDHGDSGGPVFFIGKDNTYYVIGDTSWGVTLSDKNGQIEAYHGCVDNTGSLNKNKDISFFTDLTYGSKNYRLLQKDLELL